MTVSIVANAASTATRPKSADSSRFENSVRALIATGTSSSNTYSDTPTISAAISLQTQIAGLRTASLNIAQASSALDVAASNATGINTVLSRLDALAQRASTGDLSASERLALDNEFAALRSQITRLSSSAQFGNKAVLDGTLTLADIGLAQDINNEVIGLPNLSDQALYSSSALSIASQSDASQTRQILANAQTTVSTALENIREFQSTLEIASATIDSALNNQEASRSTLVDSDLDALATTDYNNPAQTVEAAGEVSQQAQTNRLPPSLLQLLVG